MSYCARVGCSNLDFLNFRLRDAVRVSWIGLPKIQREINSIVVTVIHSLIFCINLFITKEKAF